MPTYRPISSHFIDAPGRGPAPYKVELSRVDGTPPSVYRPTAPGDSSPAVPRNRDEFGGYAVPHVSTFAARYNLHAKAYYYLFDEALKYGQRTTLALRHDPFIYELCRHRQLPSATVPYYVEPEEAEDPEQTKVCKQVESVVKATHRFQLLRLILQEAIFFGKSAAQIKLGRKMVNGVPRTVVTGHVPVNGDKLRFKWDGTPGVQVRNDAGMVRDRYARDVERVDQSAVLWMHDKGLRDLFVIHEFEPSDTDYMFEGDQAGAVHGLGLRSRLFWAWNLRAELLAWYCDALQRVGANGMLIGLSKSGNKSARDAVEKALLNLQRDNWAVFETDGMPGKLEDMIHHIEPSPVGYDNLFNLIAHLEEIMRQAALGQNLSSQSSPTGMNSGNAELQGDMFANYIRYDAVSLAETIDEQLLPTLLKNNTFAYRGKVYRGDQLPFRPSYRHKVDERNVAERINSAGALAALGVTLDSDQLRDVGGFSPPKGPQTTIPPQAMTQPGPGAPPPNGAPAGRNGTPQPQAA